MTDTIEEIAVKRPRNFLSPEQVAKIRELRAIPHPDKPFRAKYTHDQVGEMVGCTGALVSHVARNRKYFDENYTPVHDGHMDRGPMPRDENGVVIRKAKPEKAEAPTEDAEGEATTDEEADV